MTVEAPGADIEVIDGSVGKLEVGENAADTNIKLTSGSIDKLDLNAKADLDIVSGTVKDLNINENASGTQVDIGQNASVTNLNANAAVNVAGTGNVENANIASDGVKFEKAPEKYTISEGKSADIGGTITTGSDDSTGGGGGGGGGGDTTPGIPLSAISDNLAVAVSESVYAGVSTNVEGVSIVYSSSNTSIATVNAASGLITGVAAGTATITATASKGGYKTTTKSLTVAVGVRSEEGVLLVFPNQATKNTRTSIDIGYLPADPTSNGTVAFSLPEQFAAADGDYVWNISEGSIIISGNQSGNLTRTVTVSDSGKTVTVTNVQSYIFLTLYYKEVPAAGTLSFSATYDKDGPAAAMLPSSGTGYETDTLEVVSTVTSLGSVQSNAGGPHCLLTWSKPAGAQSVAIKQRIAGEEDWVDVSGSVYALEDEPITYEDEIVDTVSGAEVYGLTSGVEYEFKITVTGGENEGDSNITTLTFDATPPEFAEGYPSVVEVNDNSVQLAAESDENAYYNYLVLTTEDYTALSASDAVYTPLSADDIVNWSYYYGDVELGVDWWCGYGYGEANMERIIEIPNLYDSTNYTVFLVAEDMRGNYSAVKPLTFTTAAGAGAASLSLNQAHANARFIEFDNLVKSNDNEALLERLHYLRQKLGE